MSPSARTAAAASIALHLALIGLLARLPWGVREEEKRDAYRVVWLSEPPASILEPAPERPSPERATPPEAEERETDEPTDAVPQPQPREAMTDEEAGADEAEPEDGPPDAPDEPTDTRPRRAYSRAEVDLDEERRRAVERALEQSERAKAQRTFSFDDIVEEPPPAEPGPAKSVFESGASERVGVTVTGPGGEVFRWISDRCYTVSGGFGNIFAFPESVAAANLPVVGCGRLIPRRDLFDHLKPDYLKMRPAELAARFRDDAPSELESGQTDITH